MMFSTPSPSSKIVPRSFRHRLHPSNGWLSAPGANRFTRTQTSAFTAAESSHSTAAAITSRSQFFRSFFFFCIKFTRFWRVAQLSGAPLSSRVSACWRSDGRVFTFNLCSTRPRRFLSTFKDFGRLSTSSAATFAIRQRT